MSDLTVSIIQSELYWQDAERNLSEFSRILSQREESADLIVLPEMFTTGFTMRAAENAEPMNGRSVSWMAEQAAKTGSAICGSLIIEEDGRYYNRFILAHTNGRLDHYDKRHLFRLAGEHEHYAAGNECGTVLLKGWRIRPMVCYDLRFPVWSRNRGDYDLLIYVANWPEPRHLAWTTLARARAIENLAFVAAVNRIGTDGNGIRYAGGSGVIDFSGNYLVHPGSAAGTSTATLDREGMSRFRERFPFHMDADEYRILPVPAERGAVAHESAR